MKTIEVGARCIVKGWRRINPRHHGKGGEVVEVHATFKPTLYSIKLDSGSKLALFDNEFTIDNSVKN